MVTLVLAVVFPIGAVAVGAVTIFYAHSVGATRARNAAAVLTVLAALLMVLGGVVSGGFDS